MKAVLISIQPKWCAKIASGEKSIEVRKTQPKLEPPFKCYIYETQGEAEIPWMDEDGHMIFRGRGMVIGEFVCDRVEEFTPTEKGIAFKRFRALHETCLSVAEIRAYLGDKVGYGWHISDLVIYDELKALSEFKKHNRTCYYDHLGLATPRCKECKGCQVERPPQSWCYVEEMIDNA